VRIDRRLNLVVPVERSAGDTAYVHSQPMSRLAFEENFLIVSKVFSAIYSEGLNVFSGPRVAALLMRRIARLEAKSEEEAERIAETVEKSFFREIRRLSSLILIQDTGWETVPLQEALDRSLLSEDDAAEVENAVTFFTVASAMHRRADLRAVLDGAVQLWGAQTTPLNSTEFAHSLRTSTAGASTGATEAA
jgi:hypothetical protein